MLYGPENFNYLRQSQCYTVNGVDDAKEFADTRVIFLSLSLSLSLSFAHNIYIFPKNAMNVMTMTAEEQTACMKLIAGILHLGNVTFYDTGKGSASVADENGSLS